MRSIGFVGYDSPDIVLYLARLRAQEGENVVVVDRTKENALLSMLNMTDDIPDEDMYRDIRILKDKKLSEVEDADSVLIYYGYGIPDDEIEDVVFVFDMLPANARRLREIEVSEDVKSVSILVRNAIYVKYSEKTLIEFSGKEVSDDNIFILPFDERDYRERCYLCMDSKSFLCKLSVGMREMLFSVYTILFGDVGRKRFKEMLRRA